MSIDYLKQISDENLVKMVTTVSGISSKIKNYTIHRHTDCVTIELHYEEILYGETEPTMLSDYFEVTDHDFTPFDYASSKNDGYEWRKILFEKFGNEYAKDMLRY